MVAVLKTEYFVDAKTICTEQPMNRVVAFSFVVFKVEYDIPTDTVEPHY